jgi:hypothetical protein
VLQEKVVSISFKCRNIIPVASAKIVNADDKIAFGQQLMSQVEPKKAGTSCQQRNFAGSCWGAHCCNKTGS